MTTSVKRGENVGVRERKERGEIKKTTVYMPGK